MLQGAARLRRFESPAALRPPRAPRVSRSSSLRSVTQRLARRLASADARRTQNISSLMFRSRSPLRMCPIRAPYRTPNDRVVSAGRSSPWCARRPSWPANARKARSPSWLAHSISSLLSSCPVPLVTMGIGLAAHPQILCARPNYSWSSPNQAALSSAAHASTYLSAASSAASQMMSPSHPVGSSAILAQSSAQA